MEHTSEDIEAKNVGMNRHQQADGIDGVSHTSESQSPFHTELVDEGSTKEAEDSESTVVSGVLFRRQLEWGVSKFQNKNKAFH